ncbi:MAG TPA: thiamine pyrophosphate-dependent enzyme, partial [Blastocatellia bacterium]|nr:thiamine pyrophosphate-dependent enzyme [Blastocatellia bacterium]
HIDINPAVFNKNYSATVAIEGDASAALAALLSELRSAGVKLRDATALTRTIAAEKSSFHQSWTEKMGDNRVSPGIFFRELRSLLDRDAYLVVDDGNHTFLAVEQFPVYESKHFISPTDFNCMGYCVPAAIAVKLKHPGKQVVGIVGDGAFLMTGLEIVTAASHDLGAVFCVFHDGELAQISQFQQIPLNRKTCTVIGDIRIDGVARATGAEYLRIETDHQVRELLSQALKISREGLPVIVDVNIDYSRRTEFTRGVVKVNLGRFTLSQKLRFIGRALKRHVFR